MPCRASVYAWTVSIANHLPHLSKPQVTVLALWSLGMVLARSCALTTVTVLLAVLLSCKENTVRQRLREFTYEAPAKQGEHRRDIEVETCFRPLLEWVLANWTGTQLALALDPTSLGDRFVVLAISVVYRGCAIPVAWTVLHANQKHTWRTEWLRMLRLLWRAIPAHWTVIVLADRGLYARWLFRRIVRLHWHPFLRINAGGTFRPQGSKGYGPLHTFAPQVGSRWQGRGTAFQGPACRLECTLLVCWEPGHKETWFILTDLPPEASNAGWYGLRAWIEQGFKFTKRAGWQWQRTRMTDPARAARLWLVLAVATLWLLQVGGAADAEIPESTLPDVTPLLTAHGKHRRAQRWRLVSIFRRGWVVILTALLTGAALPLGAFVPEPWPDLPSRTTIDPTPFEVDSHATHG